MNKHKWKSNKGLKISLAAASVLLAAVIIVSAFGILLIDGFGAYNRTKKDTLESAYDRYAEIYSVMALANRDSDSMKENLKNQTNFRYGIIKADDLSAVDISDPASYEYYNFDTMPGKDAFDKEEARAYPYSIGPNTEYGWDCSLFGYAHVYENSDATYESAEERVLKDITGYYYNVADGYFYYETDEEYYRVDTVELPVGSNDNMITFVYDSGQKKYYQQSREGIVADYYLTFDRYDDTSRSWETWDYINLDGVNYSHTDIRFVDDKTATMQEFNGMPIADEFYMTTDEIPRRLDVRWQDDETAKQVSAERYRKEQYFVVSQIPSPLEKQGDLFDQVTVLVDYAYAWRYPVIAVLVIASVLWLAATLLVLIMAGHKGGYVVVETTVGRRDAAVLAEAGGAGEREAAFAEAGNGVGGRDVAFSEQTGDEEKETVRTQRQWVDVIKPGFWQKIPLDVETCILAVVATLGVVAGVEVAHPFRTHFSAVIILAAFVMVSYLAADIWLTDFVIRVKLGKWWRSMLLYKVFAWIWDKLVKGFRFLQENLTLIWKALLLLGGISLLELFGILVTGWEPGAELVIWIPYRLLTVAVILIGIVQANKLKEGAKRLADGDLSEKVKTEKMLWEFKKHGETLNSVGDGISIAVEKRMQSEHFRTELITNVSHDIKTPLTSIINYVDLLQKEEIDNEKAKEYLEVLSRQSARLKKLTEDLLEASKASTGSLAVNLERLELGVFLTQTVGEFEEKIQAAGLTTLMHKPEEEVFVNADGKHLWRVVENLVQNICKYAQPQTRVYIDLYDREREAVISFKNISRYELNISGEELMERFVRGDASRHTEGSGLGLSIAESLMVLMHGKLEIVVDGDLFKVVLHFPK